MSEIILLYSPFPNMAAARVAGLKLLEAKLVACCNILPAGESHFWWEGKLTQAEEAILIAKTSPILAPKAAQALEDVHPYEAPAILRISAKANPAFSQWVEKAGN